MRATFEVTIDVADFVEAGRHEVFLREVRAALEERFGRVDFTFREQRPRGGQLGEALGPRPRVSTGRLRHYAG